MDFRASSAQDNAHRMVYIADLPRHTSYLDLSDFYEKNVGPCQICIKRPLFKNFYYAFVMFESIENAKKAAQEFRFPRVKNGLMSRALPYNLHAIRGEPGGRDVQTTSIFVKGFEKLKWNHEDLYAKFCEFGKILSCKVSIGSEHQFLGYGYIQFSAIAEAQKAIEQMDKYDLSRDVTDAVSREALQGHQLMVLEYHSGTKKTVRKGIFNNVYVKNFPKESTFTEDDLATLFKDFGEIQSTAIMRDGNGDSKGFGFVCFKEPAAAEKAIQHVARSEAAAAADEEDGKVSQVQGVKVSDLYVVEAKKKSQRTAELLMSNFKFKKSIMFFSLFVKNFPVGTTEDELKIYFQTACQGEVSRVNIVKGTQQAFVNFEKQDQCKMAKEFARNVLFKSQYALYVEYCYPKEMRSIRNEEIHDKKAQDRKRAQASQAQIASLNGSQNLIDLLTLLLKPAFQLNQGGGQRRSHSLNVQGNANRGQGYGNNYNNHQPQANGAPMQNRYNAQKQYGNRPQQMGQQMVRHQSVAPSAMAGQSMPMMQQQMATQQMMAANQAAMIQQRMPMPASGSEVSSSNNASSTATPQFVDTSYAQNYYVEVRNMFASQEYKKAQSRREQKELIGNTIYKHVEKLVGEVKAPKITGMLIDLPEVELNYSIIQWSEFEQKVMSALQMISRGGPEVTETAPVAGETQS